MMAPSSMALTAIVVMLWILWSDTLRSKKPHPMLYSVRIVLFLIMTVVLIMNLIRFPELYNGTTRTMTIVGAVIGVIGAGYFFRKVVRR